MLSFRHHLLTTTYRHLQTTKKHSPFLISGATAASLSNRSVTYFELADKTQHWRKYMTWRRVLAVTVSCSEDGILYLKSEVWLIYCTCATIVDFDSFQKVLNRPGGFRDPGEPEEYCRGFQVFDKDMTGFIGVGQLRYSTCLSIVRRLATTMVEC